MKGFINKLKNILLLGVVVLSAASCDLALQREWEYVKEPVGNQPTGLTAMEWLTMINTDTTYNETDGTPQFEYLTEAIELTGMSDVYGDVNSEKTFFILTNQAMKVLIKDATGSDQTPLADMDVEVLKRALQYHIVTVKLGQNDIPKNDFHFYYETLLEGEDGEIEIAKRLFSQKMRINSDIPRPSLPAIKTKMPSTRKGVEVFAHNYIFTNGIGHQLNSYVRKAPFWSND
ncbi:fasciclin domain-containing protein [Flammeovirga sp. OC4]|uniref:fasciclin domain-containing protein n=1 Tax=Flammeovirga sp. OC4 TaxID=1382345 RepID=UPI0005C51436|nr:fasciclin domain-containing protein [Flammeovirga sp. OC4]